MQCNEFLNYSGEWMEGGRSTAASEHLKSCANCRGLIADMVAVIGTIDIVLGEVDR